MNQVVDKVKIDYDRLREELRKQGKTNSAFSVEMGQNESFVSGLKKNPEQPETVEKIMCMLLGLDKGSLIVAEDTLPEQPEVTVLVNIHRQITEEMKLMEDMAENIEKIWNKVHANTIQLERLRDCVKRFEKSDYEIAVDFLRDALRDGKVNGEEILMRSDSAGIKRSDLMKAKGTVGVDTAVTGYGKNQKTWWFIPK